MDFLAWKTAVDKSIRHIASREFQENAWFGQGDVVSSPDEQYCELFDDFDFDAFLEHAIGRLSPSKVQKGRELRDALEAYSGLIGEQPDPSRVIDDARWEKIRQHARSYIDTRD